MLSKKIKKRIQRKGRGFVFAAQDFLDLGSRDSVDQTLSRLTRHGVIRRVARGLYDYPRVNPQLGVELSPDPIKVAQVVAKKAGSQLQVTGAYAANLLGLTTQVPARIVYCTDGAAKRIKIGNQIIELRRASPKTMAMAGTKTGLVMQALRHLGKEGITEDTIVRLRAILFDADKAELKRGMAYAPVWMHSVLDKLLLTEEEA